MACSGNSKILLYCRYFDRDTVGRWLAAHAETVNKRAVLVAQHLPRRGVCLVCHTTVAVVLALGPMPPYNQFKGLLRHNRLALPRRFPADDGTFACVDCPGRSGHAQSWTLPTGHGNSTYCEPPRCRRCHRIELKLTGSGLRWKTVAGRSTHVRGQAGVIFEGGRQRTARADQSAQLKPPDADEQFAAVYWLCQLSRLVYCGNEVVIFPIRGGRRRKLLAASAPSPAGTPYHFAGCTVLALADAFCLEDEHLSAPLALCRFAWPNCRAFQCPSPELFAEVTVQRTVMALIVMLRRRPGVPDRGAGRGDLAG